MTKIDEALTNLYLEVAQLLDLEEWAAWLTTCRRFPTETATNQLLIRFARPDATMVADYRQWQRMHRQVIPGQRGFNIIRDRQLRDRTVPGLVTVFDLVQTSGRRGPVDPSWVDAHAGPEDCFDRLAGHLHQMLRVDVVVLAGEMAAEEIGNAGAVLRRRLKRILVRRTEPEVMLHALLHEVGHLFDPMLEGCEGYGFSPRAAAELVADSVAWMAMADVGVTAHPTLDMFHLRWAQLVAGDDHLGDAIVTLANRIVASYQQVRRVVGILMTADLQLWMPEGAGSLSDPNEALAEGLLEP